MVLRRLSQAWPVRPRQLRRPRSSQRSRAARSRACRRLRRASWRRRAGAPARLEHNNDKGRTVLGMMF